jgi:hypothetical protein
MIFICLAMNTMTPYTEADPTLPGSANDPNFGGGMTRLWKLAKNRLNEKLWTNVTG